MKLFLRRPDNRSASAVMPAGREIPSSFDLLNKQAQSRTWSPPTLVWDPADAHAKGKVADAANWFTATCFAASLVNALFLDRRGIELLPVRIEGDDWFVLNTLGVLKGVCLEASEFLLLPPEELNARLFKWVNLVHAEPLPFECFKLQEGVPGQTFFTAPFVDRYHALGLKGLTFELAGHVIDSPEQAVPPPPRPAPKKSAPRRRAANLSLADLPADWAAELVTDRAAARAALALGADPPADMVLSAIERELLRLRQTAPDGPIGHATAALQLAVLYGDLVCRQAGWSWALLRQGRSGQMLAVRSPDGAHALPVAAYLAGQIDKPEHTLRLLLNMIVAGSLPPAEPGTVALVC